VSAGASDADKRGDSEGLTVFREWYEKLNFEEQICWSFDVVPSQVLRIYWTFTYADLRYKLRIKSGEFMIGHHQQFEALVKVINQALGGGKGNGTPTPKRAFEPQTAAQMDAAFASVFG
jgi:hypothetical protein